MQKKIAISLIITFLFALLPLPYGMFQLIRLWVTVGAVILILGSTKNNVKWFFIFTALLFQPFCKMPLGRELWMIVDIVMAIIFSILLHKKYFKEK